MAKYGPDRKAFWGAHARIRPQTLDQNTSTGFNADNIIGGRPGRIQEEIPQWAWYVGMPDNDPRYMASEIKYANAPGRGIGSGGRGNYSPRVWGSADDILLRGKIAEDSYGPPHAAMQRQFESNPLARPVRTLGTIEGPGGMGASLLSEWQIAGGEKSALATGEKFSSDIMNRKSENYRQINEENLFGGGSKRVGQQGRRIDSPVHYQTRQEQQQATSSERRGSFGHWRGSVKPNSGRGSMAARAAAAHNYIADQVGVARSVPMVSQMGSWRGNGGPPGGSSFSGHLRRDRFSTGGGLVFPSGSIRRLQGGGESNVPGLASPKSLFKGLSGSSGASKQVHEFVLNSDLKDMFAMVDHRNSTDHIPV